MVNKGKCWFKMDDDDDDLDIDGDNGFKFILVSFFIVCLFKLKFLVVKFSIFIVVKVKKFIFKFEVGSSVGGSFCSCGDCWDWKEVV